MSKRTRTRHEHTDPTTERRRRQQRTSKLDCNQKYYMTSKWTLQEISFYEKMATWWDNSQKVEDLAPVLSALPFVGKVTYCPEINAFVVKNKKGQAAPWQICLKIKDYLPVVFSSLRVISSLNSKVL